MRNDSSMDVGGHVPYDSSNTPPFARRGSDATMLQLCTEPYDYPFEYGETAWALHDRSSGQWHKVIVVSEGHWQTSVRGRDDTKLYRFFYTKRPPSSRSQTPTPSPTSIFFSPTPPPPPPASTGEQGCVPAREARRAQYAPMLGELKPDYFRVRALLFASGALSGHEREEVAMEVAERERASEEAGVKL